VKPVYTVKPENTMIRLMDGGKYTSALILVFRTRQWFYGDPLPDMEKGILIESADSRTKTGTQDDSLSIIKDTELLRILEEDLKVAPSFSFCYDCSCSILKRRSFAGRRSLGKKTDHPIGVSLIIAWLRLM
jgi:hypothetical protein